MRRCPSAMRWRTAASMPGRSSRLTEGSWLFGIRPIVTAGSPSSTRARGSGVVDAQVGEEHAVDAAVGREPAVAVELGVGAGRHLQHQRVATPGQHRLDAGDERGEERVGAEQLGLAGHHQTDRQRPLRRQRPGRGAGCPAELVRGRQDASPSRLGDARSTVQGERDRALRDLRCPRHVVDRGPPGRRLMGGHGGYLTGLVLLKQFMPISPEIRPPLVRRCQRSKAAGSGWQRLAARYAGADRAPLDTAEQRR